MKTTDQDLQAVMDNKEMQEAVEPKPKKRQRKKSEKQLAKEQEKRELELAVHRLETARASFRHRLLQVESCGEEIAEDASATVEEIEAEIEKINAEARRVYLAELEKLGMDRTRAGLAAQALVEAREDEDRTRKIRRAEVRRAKRRLEYRIAFYEALLTEWAHEQELQTKRGFRLPEAGVRMEVWEDPPGWRITDDRAACESLIDELGAWGALDAGVVCVRYELVRKKAREYLAQTGLVIEGAIYESDPRKRIKIVRM